MTRIIALDGGTTNTRLTLMEDGRILNRIKLSVGARNGKAALSDELRARIPTFLAENGMTESDIAVIAASGMVTSELGLCTVPHIAVPVGVSELADRAHRVSITEICDIPFIFIPGVKTFATSDGKLADMDIMRGEETETVAILHALGLQKKSATLILPGSHMKIVMTDDGRITRFSTTMSGELSRAAAENTILSNSIGDAFFRDLDIDALHHGYALADTLGMSAALFKLRIADNFVGADKRTLYSMLLGSILHDDVKAVVVSAHGTVAVGGSDPFRAAYLALLEGKVNELIGVSEALAENAAAHGAWMIAKRIL